MLFFLLAVVSCSGDEEQPTEELYVPPTRVIQKTPTVMVSHVQTATPLPIHPTATIVCTNILSFVDDVTIPDGSKVAPGEQLDKRWLLENSGTCNWNESYSLQLIAGSNMGANPVQKLFPARSGTEFQVRIVFTAPQEKGIYRSAWQAFDPNGNPFGDPFYIEIVVTDIKPND